MRPAPALVVFAILAHGLATFGQPALTPPGAPRPASPVPVPMPPRSPRPPSASPAAPLANPQPTLLQIDAYQVETTLDRAAAMELGNIGQNKPARTEILRRLNEFGTARLVMRFDGKVNLSTPISFNSGSRMPVIQDITISAAGQATPSVSYTNIGTILHINGSWRDAQPGTADVTLSFELSGVGKTSVEISSGVRLPSFNTLKMEQFLTLESGRPVLIMTSDLPEPGDEKGKTVLTILSIMAQRLDDQAQTRPAEEASAGPPAIIEAQIMELTGNRDKLDVEEIERQLPKEGTLEQGLEIVKKFGAVEVLSRPRILVKWPQDAQINIGERVPQVEEINTDSAGKPVSKIRYEDVGLQMKVRGRWLEGEGPARAELGLSISQQTLGTSKVNVGGGISLPVLTQRSTERVLVLEAGKPLWIASSGPLPKDGDQGSLLLVRLTVRRPT